MRQHQTYYRLDNVQRKEIETFFYGKFAIKNNKSVFRINCDEKIKNIATGKFNEIISMFKDSKIDVKLINRIFDYQKFIKNKEWNRHMLISKLNINVCPYCNRQYITNYYCEKSNMLKTTADLDHFYSQEDFPYLALSLYNFIPSCQICNSRFKKNINFKNVEHIYPYDEEFKDNANFKTKGLSIDYLLGNSKEFDIFIDVKESKYKDKINNSIKTFKLNDVYKSHVDYVQEIIKKAIIYSESEVNELIQNFSDLFSSKEELLRIIFGNYIIGDDFGKRPLSKLTKDICEELGLNFE